MKNIGNVEVLQSESWGLVTGLKLAKELDITHIVVESDSVVLVNLMQSSELELHPLGTLRLNCKALMESFTCCSVH